MTSVSTGVTMVTTRLAPSFAVCAGGDSQRRKASVTGDPDAGEGVYLQQGDLILQKMRFHLTMTPDNAMD